MEEANGKEFHRKETQLEHKYNEDPFSLQVKNKTNLQKDLNICQDLR